MNSVVNKAAKTARLEFNLADENDRLTFIAWLKQLVPAHPQDQFAIDNAIIAAGGDPSLPDGMTREDLLQ